MNTDALYQEIGRRVRMHRIERGLSQAQLGNPAGLIRTSVVNLEAGRQRVPLPSLYLIATELRCSIFDLLPESLAGLPREFRSAGEAVWL